MIPEPQIPEMSSSRVVGMRTPGSSDHRSLPITLTRGSSVSRSMRTRSIAPAVARMPAEIWAPSKAGPVGDDAARTCVELPNTISAFVPTSTSSWSASDCDAGPRRGSRRRCRRRRGRRCTAADRPKRTARRCRDRAARAITALSVASRNGAWPSGVGSMPRITWCMIGLPTMVMSSTDDRSIGRSVSTVSAASATSAPTISSSADADRPSQLDLAARIHHHVRHPRHQVVAEPDLRVHDAVGGDDLAGAEVDEVAGDGRRTDVDRDAERTVDVARIDGADIASVPHADGDRVRRRAWPRRR